MRPTTDIDSRPGDAGKPDADGTAIVDAVHAWAAGGVDQLALRLVRAVATNPEPRLIDLRYALTSALVGMTDRRWGFGRATTLAEQLGLNATRKALYRLARVEGWLADDLPWSRFVPDPGVVTESVELAVEELQARFGATDG